MWRTDRVILVLALAAILGGCDAIIGKLEEQAEQAAQQAAQQAVPGQTPPTQEEQELAELTRYVECLNWTIKRTREAANYYWSYLPRDKEVSCKERGYIYALHEQSLESCNQAAKLGPNQGGEWPELEGAAAAFAKVNAETVPLAQKMHDYWDQEDYKDDDCAKGKEYHAQFAEVFDRFDTAAKAFEKELAEKKSKADRAALARVEKQRGKNWEWHIRNYMLLAKECVDLIPEETSAIDNEAFVSAYTRLEEAYNALQAHADGHKEEIDAAFMSSGFDSTAKDFYASVKFVKRVLAEEKPKPSDISEKILEMFEEYDDLVSDVNSISFRYEM